MPRYALRFLLAALALSVCPYAALEARSSGPHTAESSKSISVDTTLDMSVAGRIRGRVHDDLGAAIDDAAVIAMGATLTAARSDASGRFSLVLAPGEYVLRATRDGYVSTYREAVRVTTRGDIERNITLTRGAATLTRVAALAAPGARPPRSAGPGLVGADGDTDGDAAHDELAWRLRHLPRTVLRDVGEGSGSPGVNASNFSARTSLVDGLMAASTSYFANTEFSGEVNFLTSGSTSPADGWTPADLPRGIASAAVSAPIGDGDWHLRGATTAGSLSSWVILGDYESNARQAHAFSIGASYGAQMIAAAPPNAEVLDRRGVGRIHAADDWRLGPRVDLSYGAEIDRYDYVAASNLLSPHVAARVLVTPATTIVAGASRQLIAPGADEFLPPSAPGPWLPPERTFAPLVQNEPMQAESVQTFTLGVERALWTSPRAPVLTLRRFAQVTGDQVATLFGVDASNGSGHYDVATAGSVNVDGWALEAAVPIGHVASARATYSLGDAEWTPGIDGLALARVAPALVRSDRERVQSLTSAIDLTVPRTTTLITVAVRTESADGWTNDAATPRVFDHRFDVRLRQTLPYQPIRGGHLDLVFEVRNLLRDLDDAGSLYDELFTVAPPRRIVGGVQVRF